MRKRRLLFILLIFDSCGDKMWKLEYSAFFLFPCFLWLTNYVRYLNLLILFEVLWRVIVFLVTFFKIRGFLCAAALTWLNFIILGCWLDSICLLIIENGGFSSLRMYEFHTRLDVLIFFVTAQLCVSRLQADWLLCLGWLLTSFISLPFADIGWFYLSLGLCGLWGAVWICAFTFIWHKVFIGEQTMILFDLAPLLFFLVLLCYCFQHAQRLNYLRYGDFFHHVLVAVDTHPLSSIRFAKFITTQPESLHVQHASAAAVLVNVSSLFLKWDYLRAWHAGSDVILARPYLLDKSLCHQELEWCIVLQNGDA